LNREHSFAYDRAVALLDRDPSAGTVQGSLFDEPLPPSRWPEGLVYEPDWLGAGEEADLIALFATLPFANAPYKQYVARRRIVSYGGRYDFDANRLMPGAPLVEALEPVRDRVAAWAGVEPEALGHVLIGEYSPGTPLGWHRDVPDFEEVFGVSLGGPATLRFRPYATSERRRDAVVRVEVAPRAIYAMRGPSRWDWQHCVAPVPALRWSITFRTRAARRRNPTRI
jgi:alkylated DNA repair dioxygenase AlkB